MTGKKWAWLKELRFLQLTLYIIFFLFAFPLLGHEWLLQLFSSIFLLNALLVSLSASGRIIRFQWLFWLLFSGAVLFSFLHVVPVNPALRPVFLNLAIVLDILLRLCCLATILAFIFASPLVTLDTIFAAVVAYLLIAVAFAQAYLLLFYAAPQSFNLPPADPVDSYTIFHGMMLYFSLVIITTVGVGDIVPLTPVARTLTVIEAMIGQFFVAILVAWLVGRFISQSSRPQPPPD
jgi:voltage-gated potassium channel